MAKIIWIDLDGNKQESEEYTDIKSLRSYIKKNIYVIKVVELLDCKGLDSLYDESTKKGLFENCPNLVEVKDVVGTLNILNMKKMFANCEDLKKVLYFDTSNVKNMNCMFSVCESLESVPLFDTPNVEDMGYMFYYCSSLKNVPCFDTPKVEDVSYMFAYCWSLESVPLFDTSNVKDMNCMFEGFSRLKFYTLPCDEYNTRSIAIKSYKSEKLLKELNKLWQK